MSISGEDNEIILNASLSNSPDQLDVFEESRRNFLESINATVSMTSNGSKNGIEDIANRLKQNGNTTSTSLTSNSGLYPTDPTIISNHTPSMQLSCVECGVTKANSEEMEIHIKTEHLKWLPFQCPMCLVERASDAQMREHLHSSHQKNMSKFIYVDNVKAKRRLQILMDSAFSLNVSERVNAKNHPSSSTSASPYSPTSYHRGMNSSPSSGRNTSTSNGSATSAATASAQAAATAIVNHHKEKEKQTAQATADFLKLLDFTGINGEIGEHKAQSSSTRSSSGRKRPYVPTSATEAITTMELAAPSAESFLASLNSFSHAQTPENEENDHPTLFSVDDLNIDSTSTLATLFGGGARKTKYDDGEMPHDEDPLLDSLNPISVLDNVAALFGSTPDRSVETETKKTSSISKKRVLGECSKCQKPVTAGARQMHMFFHLAKDELIFRFRCKHEGCSVEHYRKDQMENHQSKAHGRIDPDMMEDRSLELFQKCQISPWNCSELKMERYPDRLPQKLKSPMQHNKQPTLNGFGPLKLVPDEDHPLQCRLCGKTMQNRIRGFHILWHMAKDKGINRYTCKYCNFGHDRSQSVQVHGKKEHGTDDCVEDRIGEYQDDVKEMSASCFGISSLFAQESKRKNKFPAAAPREHKDLVSMVSSSHEASPAVPVDEEASNDSAIKEEEKPLILNDEEMEELGEDDEVEHEQEHEDEDGEGDEDDDGEGEETTPITSSKSSKKKWRRAFNIRSKKSKKQKEDAVVARSVSILIGGAQFYKKKVNEFCYCEKCGKQTNSRLPEHAYTHMDGVELYSCSACSFGNQCKETVMKHMRESHPLCAERCVDNRLGHIKEIKKQLGQCFPAFFIDHPLPTRSDIEKLQILASGGDLKIGGIEKYLKEECEDGEPSEAPEDEEMEEDDDGVSSD
ncbi:C2H2-type domain-containing protein [Caenorhabditis elegans]|uniref:C2H2-type domain-containing protein n=1 Tax=Caenorhabditis elegans TaxID=6239 RepID=I7K4K0_CAEEL|nr:C2H2-type domain-containing protein [Caenorhabditis elegans]CCJ09414.2 C2H2-type domain-containing protein [Caenorhabditis elegans]|eukprot:NP_001343698.1 SUPpressor [Caenorhabditis elegans]